MASQAKTTKLKRARRDARTAKRRAQSKRAKVSKLKRSGSLCIC